MPDSIATQRQRYPLAVYNFRVKVGEALLSFTEVSGIALSYEQVTYRHGLSFLEGEQIETFAFDRFQAISCKRGAVLGSSPLYLHDWLKSRELRSMEVSLCDEKGDPVLAWKIAAAVPTSLKAPPFSAAGKDPVIDTLDLQVRGVSLVTL